MTTIKVYKTTVNSHKDAELIAELIRNKIPSCCDISFDLEDSDRVLRIENLGGEPDETLLRKIFENRGHKLDILPL